MDYFKARITRMEIPARDHAILRFTRVSNNFPFPTQGKAGMGSRGDSDIEGEPGQFVMVRGSWGAHPILPRAFSLVEVGKEGAILVRNVGEGTNLLASMKQGDELLVLGPLGHGFSLPSETGGGVALVAGCVGVAPLVFLAQRLADTGIEQVFLYGARTGDDLPLRDRIDGICDLTITTEDGSVGEKGLVTTPLERFLQANPSASVFSCGPEAMLEAVARVSVAAGARCQVALEAPMACGMGVCKGCAILDVSGEYKYVCSDGPAFESVKIFGREP